MNGHTLQTGLIASSKQSGSKPAELPTESDKTPAPTSVKPAATSFFLMILLALALGVSLAARAETPNTGKSPTAFPESFQFMTGMVSITWVYKNQDSMPFTEHHAISSAQVADAISSEGPIRVPTSDDGELLISAMHDLPGVILSARRYRDWTLVSVMHYEEDPTHSVGIFKFCSFDIDRAACASSVLSRPDGTVSMTTGPITNGPSSPLVDIDERIVTEELLALMTD